MLDSNGRLHAAISSVRLIPSCTPEVLERACLPSAVSRKQPAQHSDDVLRGSPHALKHLGARLSTAADDFTPEYTTSPGPLSDPSEFHSVEHLLAEHLPPGNKQPAKTTFGHFYGSSYIAAPDASRCKGLSRTRDGVVIAEADLNLCRQVKDLWCLQMTARHADYAKFLSDYVAPDYKPQVVKDPSLS